MMKQSVCCVFLALVVALQMGCATKLSPKKMPEIATSQMTGQQAVSQLTRLNVYSGQFNKFYPDATSLTKRISNGDGVEAASAIVKLAPYSKIGEITYIKYNPRPFKIGYVIELHDLDGKLLFNIRIDDGKELTHFMTAFYKLCPALRNG